MARRGSEHDFAPILDAARRWIDRCLIDDGSILGTAPLWSAALVAEVREAFVEHLDDGEGDFLSKLRGQLQRASPQAHCLMAEMLWALYLFPSNFRPSSKRRQITSLWQVSAEALPDAAMLADDVLRGIGSGGPGFHNHRWREVAYLIGLAEDLKRRPRKERASIFSEYDAFMRWIEQVPMDGYRQFRHMLRYFAFPERVERMSSNGERRAVLAAFNVAPQKETGKWSDRQLDEELFRLRRKLEAESPGRHLDFYDPPLKARWQADEAAAPAAAADVDDEDELAVALPDGPVNRIFYGPPGTGKTYWLQRRRVAYTDAPGAVDRETWLQELVAQYGWRPVIAVALADLKAGARVPAIRDHPLAQAKARQRGRTPSSVSATIWGYLQEHTPEETSTVRTATRRAPFIFSKHDDGQWRLLADWRDTDEESAELYARFVAGPRGASTPAKRYRVVTFHPSFSYEEFVRGIRPVADEDGTAQFRMVDGVFKQICDEARANPSKRYALFIDEINRANIAKVFGELITLIEPDKRVRFDAEGRPSGGIEVQLPGGEGGDVAEPLFSVPANLDIYGTMNTADRSIALLDVALRRRFEFVEMEPVYTLLGEPIEGVQLDRLLRRINDRLEYLLDRERRIGHAYLMKVRTLEDLRRAFQVQIIPLLQEYFFDDFGRVALVLSTADGAPPFFQREELRRSDLFAEVASARIADERERFHITEASTWTAATFQGIYGGSPDADAEVGLA